MLGGGHGAHDLTRATGASPCHRPEHRRSRPSGGLDRSRTATVISGSTRRSRTSATARRLYASALWSRTPRRDPAPRGNRPRHRRGGHRGVLDRVPPLSRPRWLCSSRSATPTRDSRRRSTGHCARGDGELRPAGHRSAVKIPSDSALPRVLAEGTRNPTARAWPPTPRRSRFTSRAMCTGAMTSSTGASRRRVCGDWGGSSASTSKSSTSWRSTATRGSSRLLRAAG